MLLIQTKQNKKRTNLLHNEADDAEFGGILPLIIKSNGSRVVLLLL